MSYGIANDHVYSNLSGQKYYFKRDPDGSDRRRALAELQTDDQRIRDAGNERAQRTIGRPLTTKELRQGNWEPDTRSARERIAADGVTTSQREHNGNPHASRLNELKAQPARTAADRERLQLRIDMAQREHDLWVAERLRVLERDTLMNSSKVTDAVADATAWFGRLQFNGSVPQAWVDRARQRLERLKTDGDAEAYWSATYEFETEYDTAKNAQADALDQQAKEFREQAAAVRRDEKVMTADE